MSLILYMQKLKFVETQFISRNLASNLNFSSHSMLESKWNQQCHFNSWKLRSWFAKQYLQDCSAYQTLIKPIEITWGECQTVPNSVDRGWGLRFYISNMIPGDADDSWIMGYILRKIVQLQSWDLKLVPGGQHWHDLRTS